MYYAENKKKVKSRSHQVHRQHASSLTSTTSYQRSHTRWKAATKAALQRYKGGGKWENKWRIWNSLSRSSRYMKEWHLWITCAFSYSRWYFCVMFSTHAHLSGLPCICHPRETHTSLCLYHTAQHLAHHLFPGQNPKPWQYRSLHSLKDILINHCVKDRTNTALHILREMSWNKDSQAYPLHCRTAIQEKMENWIVLSEYTLKDLVAF